MDLNETMERLESSDIFKKFSEDNPHHYLVHAFTMITQGHEDWQLGYYSEESDKVVVFEMGGEITQAPEQEVLKREEHRVEKLNLDTVKLDVEGALKTADKIAGEKHSGEIITKKILILQNLKGDQIYNITLVTTNFNIINLKISAENGAILKESKQSIMSLGNPISD